MSFAGEPVFDEPCSYDRLLHDGTPDAMRCRPRFAGPPAGILAALLTRKWRAEGAGRVTCRGSGEQSMYPEEMVAPMRAEAVDTGARECRTPEEVRAALAERTGTALWFVNSVCGCAAASARPGLRESLRGAARPDRILTVFAGQDAEAVAELRRHLVGYPPSSPCFALFTRGELAAVVERHEIQGLSAEELGAKLAALYAAHSAPASA